MNVRLKISNIQTSLYNNIQISLAVVHEYVNPCSPSPCGSNSQCREVNEQAVCSCLPTYVGSPPNCRPECVVSSECARDKACISQKCSDPCPGTCGTNANCRVNNHSPICTCRNEYTGDPFTRCFAIPRKLEKCSYTRIQLFLIPSQFSSCSNLTWHSPRSLCSITMWPERTVSKHQWSSIMLMSSNLHWNSAQLSTRM